jgi:hypothetical protein
VNSTLPRPAPAHSDSQFRFPRRPDRVRAGHNGRAPLAVAATVNSTLRDLFTELTRCPMIVDNIVYTNEPKCARVGMSPPPCCPPSFLA